MRWKFTIIRGIIETEIDEPVGWDTIGKTIARDLDTHGIFFDFSMNSLQFIETAYWIIYEEWILKGVDGDIGLRVEWACDDCEECDTWQLYNNWKLDFERYNRVCGWDCYISIGLEASDAEVLIKNRKDIAVDLTNNKAYDGETVLTDYVWLNKQIEIPGKPLKLTNHAIKTADTSYDITADSGWGTSLVTGTWQGAFMPGLDGIQLAELDPFSPQAIDDFFRPWGAPSNTGATQIFEVKEITQLKCVSTDLIFQGRYKGKVKFNGSANKSIGVTLVVKEVQYATSAIWDRVKKQVIATSLFSFNREWDIDESFSFTIGSVPIGTRYFFMLFFEVIITTTGTRQLLVDTKKEAYFKVSATSLCPDSPTKTSLIHESGSRIVEHITNNQFKFKSHFYGRTDSQPFNFREDGCGGLRTLTNGLHLRRAVLQDSTQPKVFLSLKELYDSLNAIDCVGMGIEGTNVIIEPIRHFYTDEIIFICDGVDKISTNVKNDRIWNQFNFGYDKFETESANGLDAIHTKREYRSPIKHSDQKIEKYSKLIADGYAVEETRRKFGLSDDWRYDQNIFIICLKRIGQALRVEKGNITMGENLFDPQSIINYAITPIRNAMRWFSWLVQGVKGVPKRLMFNRGEGNYVAKGKQTNGCVIEADVMAENDIIQNSSFEDQDDAAPFTEPEQDTFTYPVGMNEFVMISTKKYGKIQYRESETAEWRYGWIEKVVHNANDGQADFTLTRCK